MIRKALSEFKSRINNGMTEKSVLKYFPCVPSRRKTSSHIPRHFFSISKWGSRKFFDTTLCSGRDAASRKRGRHCEKYRPSFGTFCPQGSFFNCSLRNYYRDNLQSQQNTLHRPQAQIPGLCLPQNPIVCIQEFYRFQYLR